jgi:hypothetical protein
MVKGVFFSIGDMEKIKERGDARLDGLSIVTYCQHVYQQNRPAGRDRTPYAYELTCPASLKARTFTLPCVGRTVRHPHLIC